MYFTSLVVRCKNEPFIQEFIEHYFREGIDFIYIIDDASSLEYPKKVLKHKRVKIFWEDNIILKNIVSTIYQKIKSNTHWLIYVDADEFITTRKNNQNTIRDELSTTFSNIDCIKVPWVLMSCNNKEKNPKILLKENIYRWNHDIRHENKKSNKEKFRCRYDEIEVKCIFKTAKFNDIWDHHPKEPIGNIHCVDSVYSSKKPLKTFYSSLREADIKAAYLVCYHYRIVSRENCLSKIAGNIWYSDYSLKDLMSTDYPEVVDFTLKHKSKRKRL